MYIVTIQNGDEKKEIHNDVEKLSSGKIVQGINTIDSFSFTMTPSSVGFDDIHDYLTLVNVYNTNKDRYEFYGRVLCSDESMDESGLITKEVICESFFGFLCDSEQEYVMERKWSVGGLFQHIINTHNKQMESYKQFVLGTVAFADDEIACGIERKNTWDTLKELLLDTLGGELRFSVVDGFIYIDYLGKIGILSSTKIALSKNMQSIVKEKDPSDIVTRLIPLGYKINEQGDERLTIAGANDGKDYIDDKVAQALYGIRVKSVEFDDVTVPTTLLKRGMEWLAANNKILIGYTIKALDLSLIGLEIEDFEVYNEHEIENDLLGIADTARIIKKNIDVCEEIKSTIEFGDSFETLSEAMIKNAEALKLITSNYVTNKRFSSEITRTSTLIEQTEENIRFEVNAQYSTAKGEIDETKAELELKVGRDENDHIVSMINASADVIDMKADRFQVESTHFDLTKDGQATFKDAQTNHKVNIHKGIIYVESPIEPLDSTTAYPTRYNRLLLTFPAPGDEEGEYGLFLCVQIDTSGTMHCNLDIHSV